MTQACQRPRLSRAAPQPLGRAVLEDTMLNLVVVEGTLARPAQDVELPSGSRLISLEVTVRRDEGPAEPVPVAWFDAPAWATSLDAGVGVVVVGRVRRRFFRSGGVTQSRTEVVASRVVRAGASARVRAALDEAAAAIAAAGQSASRSKVG